MEEAIDGENEGLVETLELGTVEMEMEGEMEGLNDKDGLMEGQSLGQPSISPSTSSVSRLPPQSTVLEQTALGIVPFSLFSYNRSSSSDVSSPNSDGIVPFRLL